MPRNLTLDLQNQTSAKEQWTPHSKTLQYWLQRTIDLTPSNASATSDLEACIRLVSDVEIHNINKTFRNKDKATNILSFPASESIPESVYRQLQPIPLGDIVLCPDIINTEAQQQNKTIEAHWAHLSIHGLLHLLGYDHIVNSEAEEMELLEINILKSLGFSNPYI